MVFCAVVEYRLEKIKGRRAGIERIVLNIDMVVNDAE